MTKKHKWMGWGGCAGRYLLDHRELDYDGKHWIQSVWEEVEGDRAVN